MKGLMLALCVLMFTGMAQAALDTLSVKLSPQATKFTSYDHVVVTANSNVRGAEYRFMIERLFAGGTTEEILSTDWSSQRDFEVIQALSFAHDQPIKGKFRVHAFARQHAVMPEISRTKELTFVDPDDPSYQKIHDINTLRSLFDIAVFMARNELAVARKKLETGFSTDYEFVHLLTTDDFINRVLNNPSLSDHVIMTPDRSSPVFISGKPGDGDANGAIVIEVEPPAAPDDMNNAVISITLPAWPAVGGLKRRTEIVRWND